MKTAKSLLRGIYTPAASPFARRRRLRVGAALISLTIVPAVYYMASPPHSQAQPTASPDLVISQLYGGGGNSGASYSDDFVEIYNRGATPVTFSNWSVQYASAGGTSWDVISISGTINPGKYFLVRVETTGADGASLPPHDATQNIGANGIAVAGGKLALVTDGTALTGACPQADATQTNRVRDFVGYGASATCSENAPAPAPSSGNTTSVIRKSSTGTTTGDTGFRDTNDNSTDFAALTPPNPRNSSSAAATTIIFDAMSKGCLFSSTGLPVLPPPIPGSTTLTWQHKVGAGTNRILVVGVSTFAQPGAPANRILSVTYNGLPMTRINPLAVTSPDFSSGVEMFRRTDSDPGGLPNDNANHPVVVTTGSVVNYAVGGGASFFGVNQATPTGTFAQASNADANPRVNVASAPNEVVIDTVASVYDATGAAALTVGPGQTERWNGKNDSCFPDADGLISIGAGSTEPGAASVTMSWTMLSAHPWAVGAVPLKPLAATAVELVAFDAVRTGAGVALRWQTGHEVDNLGFNVYRERGGARERVNASLLAGSALVVGEKTPLAAGRTYQLSDGAGTDDSRYWLEDIDLDGKSTMHGPLTPARGRGGASASGPDTAVALGLLGADADEGRAARRAQEEWPAAAAAARKLLPASRQQEGGQTPVERQWELAAQRAVKIGVRRDGWYRVGQPELIAAGLDAGGLKRYLQLYAEGQEVPIIVSGTGRRLASSDYIEFYGVGLDTPEADERVYWLVAGTSPGKRIPTFDLWMPLSEPSPTLFGAPVRQTLPGESPARRAPLSSSSSESASPSISVSILPLDEPIEVMAESFDVTVERRERVDYVASMLNGEEENFFGRAITGTPVTQALDVHHLVGTGAGYAVLEVAAQGLTSAAHFVKVRLDGVEVGTLNFSGRSLAVEQFSIPYALLAEGENVVTLASSGGQSDVSLVRHVRLTYPHSYTADGDALRFSLPAGHAARVEGFGSVDVRVMDITDPASPREVETVTLGDAEGFAVVVPPEVEPTRQPRTLFAFTGGGVMSPASAAPNQPSDWHAGDRHGADLVVITHGDFRDAAARLAAARRAEGLAVEVVDVEDVYDEWGYGARGAKALRDLLSHAAADWARAPRFVLLVGDGSFDPRDYLGYGRHDFVPARQIETRQLETASDDWLADFDGDGLAEMAVGRLPVRTAGEAETIVSKITAARSGAGESLLLVNDRKGSDGYDFEAAARDLLEGVPAAVSVETINRGDDDANALRSQIIEAVNRGPLVVNFYGHGSENLWTNANLLRTQDAAALTNTDRPSLFVMMTCLNGYYNHAARESLAETLLKAERGGAVAVWASSGLTNPGGQTSMNEEFFRLLFGEQPTTLGEAARRAKAATGDRDARATWILFGDPSMKLR